MNDPIEVPGLAHAPVPAAGPSGGSFLKGFGLTVMGTLVGQLAAVVATLLVAGYLGGGRKVWIGLLLGLCLNIWVVDKAFGSADKKVAFGILAGCLLLVLLAIALVWFLNARSYAEQN